MKKKIIGDSSLDLNNDLKKLDFVKKVPLRIFVNDKEYVDTEDVNISELLKDIDLGKEPPKTTCPSPEEYMQAYDEADDEIFVVTISSKLSGSYNSANLAKNIYSEENNKKIHVFDSKSATSGETVIGLKIKELIDNGISFDEIVSKVEDFIKDLKLFFVLDNLDTLIKRGRMTSLQGKIASLLHIKPIMTAIDGEIELFEKTRGMKKALSRIVDVIGEQGKNLEQKICAIAHCNALEKAMQIKEGLLSKYSFRDVLIVETGGLSTAYANEGGIIIAF